MILEIDMGNTRLKWRIQNEQSALAQGAIGIEAPLDLLADKIEPYRVAINSVIVASVVGGLLEQKLTDWSIENLKLQPVFVRSGAICGRAFRSHQDAPGTE